MIRIYFFFRRLESNTHRIRRTLAIGIHAFVFSMYIHKVTWYQNVLLYNVCHSGTRRRKRKMGCGVVSVISNNFISWKALAKSWICVGVARMFQGKDHTDPSICTTMMCMNKNGWFYLFLQPYPQRIDFVLFWD